MPKYFNLIEIIWNFISKYYNLSCDQTYSSINIQNFKSATFTNSETKISDEQGDKEAE